MKDGNNENQHLFKPGPTQEMTYLGITYNTKEGTIKVGQILCSPIAMSSGGQQYAAEVENCLEDG